MPGAARSLKFTAMPPTMTQGTSAINTFSFSKSLEEYLDKHWPTRVAKKSTWLATKSNWPKHTAPYVLIHPGHICSPKAHTTKMSNASGLSSWSSKIRNSSARYLVPLRRSTTNLKTHSRSKLLLPQLTPITRIYTHHQAWLLFRLLSFYLWALLLQESLDNWMTGYNSFKLQHNTTSNLLSRCSANWCYTYPDQHIGKKGLISVSLAAAKALEDAFYPDSDDLMKTSPQWLSDAVQDLQSGMHLGIPRVTVHNVWEVF